MIEIPREGEYAAQADASKRRFESDDAAQGSRDADRAARIRAQCAERHASCHSNGRSRGGPAGDARRVPGVTRGPVMRIVPGHTQRDFVCVRFPQQDRAGLLQLFDNKCILIGNILCKEF